MANVIGPFGFAQVGTASGMPNFAQGHNPPYRIASTYATPIFFGDAVRYWITGDTGTSSAGYIIRWTTGDGSATKQLVGIFLGCSYYSTSQRKMVWSNYWPGADATGDVNAFICDDPNSEWKVQSGAGVTNGPGTQGFGVDIAATPSGNTVTGISGMAITTAAAASAATLPFKIVSMVTTPPTSNGTDSASAGNYVIVSFNNQIYKTQTGV